MDTSTPGLQVSYHMQAGLLASPVPGKPATWSPLTHGLCSGCWQSDKTFTFNQPVNNLPPLSSQIFLQAFNN